MSSHAQSRWSAIAGAASAYLLCYLIPFGPRPPMDHRRLRLRTEIIEGLSTLHDVAQSDTSSRNIEELIINNPDVLKRQSNKLSPYPGILPEWRYRTYSRNVGAQNQGPMIQTDVSFLLPDSNVWIVLYWDGTATVSWDNGEGVILEPRKHSWRYVGPGGIRASKADLAK